MHRRYRPQGFQLPLPAKELTDLAKWRKDLTATAEYAPTWVIVSIALALGCGTMVGWRRIVYTVGEKIGSSGMTYSQGIAAQITQLPPSVSPV